MKEKNSPERDWLPYMKRALELARIAEKRGDVPVGALVLNIDGKIIAESYNQRELRKDPTAHAEVLALREASISEGSWRLTGCTLVVTLEPCFMCAGALALSRIDRVVYGCSDPRAGAMGSAYALHNDARLNHQIVVESGVMGEECQAMIRGFFQDKRKNT